MADIKNNFDQLPSSESIITEEKLTEELKDTKKTLADLKNNFDQLPSSESIRTEEKLTEELKDTKKHWRTLKKVLTNIHLALKL